MKERTSMKRYAGGDERWSPKDQTSHVYAVKYSYQILTQNLGINNCYTGHNCLNQINSQQTRIYSQRTKGQCKEQGIASLCWWHEQKILSRSLSPTLVAHSFLVNFTLFHWPVCDCCVETERAVSFCLLRLIF